MTLGTDLVSAVGLSLVISLSAVGCSAGADGTRLAPFDIATLWEGIDQIARVMDAQDAGRALIADLQAPLAKVSRPPKAMGNTNRLMANRYSGNNQIALRICTSLTFSTTST